MTDQVRQVTADLVDRLGPAALHCDDGEVADLDRAAVVRVSAFDVATAARCPMKAAGPAQEFEPSIFTSSRSVALRSISRLRRTESVLEAVSATMRALRQADREPGDVSGPDIDWLGRYLADESVAPLDVRVRIAARAVTWLTTTLDVLDGDVAENRRPVGWRHDIRPRWRYPGRGLSLSGRVDVAMPAAGGLVPVFVVNTVSRVSLDEIGYSLCLWIIGRRRIPDQVVVVELSTARRHVIAAGDLIGHGIDAAERTTVAVVARETDPNPGGGPNPGHVVLDRTPSRTACGDCHWRSGCDPRSQFEQQPIRRGGLRLSPDNPQLIHNSPTGRG